MFYFLPKFSTKNTVFMHEIFLLINVKMPTVVGILTCMSRKNSILGFFEPEKKLNFFKFLYLGVFKIPCSAELSMEFFV